MILFQSDYIKYSTAIVDYQTTNTSFLELAAKYHKAGYKNSLFILTLLNPRLQGLDPFSPDLTEEEKVMIAIECEDNIWYFLREICRLPPNAGIEPVRYRASRGNIAATWAFCAAIDYILIQPRQTGKSVGIDCVMVWLLYLATDNTKINLITKDAALRTSNIERLQVIRDLLPTYIYVKDKNDTSNKIGLTYNTRGNTYKTAVAQMSEAGALNVGRGQTSPIFHVDEAPFIAHIGKLLPAALAAGSAARNYARKIGAYNGTIFTTTAGKKDDPNGKVIYDMVEESYVWDEALFDCKHKDELHDVVYKGTKGIYKRIYMEFSHTQLGFDDNWLLAALADSGSKGDDADRDFFNRWTSGSLQSPLSVEQNQKVMDSRMDVVYPQITAQGYSIQWYMEKGLLDNYIRNNWIVFSLDTSEAVGNDDIGGTFIDVRTGEVIGAAAINETSILTFANYVADVMIKHDKILLMVERKSTGLAIMDVVIARMLQNGINPFKRIYNAIVQEFATRTTEYEEISRYNSTRVPEWVVTKYRKHFGFVTTAGSRHELYSNVLQQAIEVGGSKIRDGKLIKQITGLVTKRGRIDHQTSGHDDLVIAYLLTYWFFIHGLNMRFYGIDPMSVLSRANQKSLQSSADEEMEEQQREFVRSVIEDIRDELTNTKDVGRRMFLKGKLEKVISKAANLLPEAVSMDGIMNEVSKSTRSNRRYRRRA